MGDLDVSSFKAECKPEKFKVNWKEQTCACRVWDLTGCPCMHAITTTGWENQRLKQFVHEYLTKATFAKAY